MHYWILRVKNLVKEVGTLDETGQTLIEYALIIAFVAIVLIGALTLLGENLWNYFEFAGNKISNMSP